MINAKINNLEKKLFWSLVFAFFLYFGLSIFADFHKLLKLIIHFNWWLIFPLFALAFSNYVLRFFRWQYYLKISKIDLKIKDSLAVFFSGLAMSVSPGKFGEILKSYFLKKMQNIPYSISAPIVLVERLTDLIAVLVLTSFGIFAFNYGKQVFWLVLILILFILFILSSKKLFLIILKVFSKIRIFQKLSSKIERAYLSAYNLCKTDKLIIGSFIGLVAWFCECLGFYLVFLGLGLNISIWNAIFIYAFSTLAGAVSFLPGGLGVTEASMVGLLVLFLKFSKSTASFATILIRFTTLWFAVIIGLMAILLNRKRLKL